MVIVFSLFATGCAFQLRQTAWTESARPEEITGTYTLILYGNSYLNDIETVAILDKEGDRYTIEPYAPDFDYRVVKGVPAKRALEQAYRFLKSGNSAYYSAQLSRIVDEKGAVIGYELRPLYEPFVYGLADVLDTNYWIKDNKVFARIKIKPFIERELFSTGGREKSLDYGGSHFMMRFRITLNGYGASMTATTSIHTISHLTTAISPYANALQIFTT